MSKQKTERKLKDNEAQAFASVVQTTPRKLNLVAGMIRGMGAQPALAALTFSKKRAAHDVKKVLQAAIANAENNHQLDVDNLVVSEAYIGKSLVMHRFTSRGRGRSSPIEKPFSNITIVVREKEEEAPKKKSKPKAEAKASA